MSDDCPVCADSGVHRVYINGEVAHEEPCPACAPQGEQRERIE